MCDVMCKSYKNVTIVIFLAIGLFEQTLEANDHIQSIHFGFSSYCTYFL